MKAIKVVAGLLLALVLVVVVVSTFVLSNLNSLVKQIVEEEGSKAFGTQVTLSEVDIQLTEAKGILKGLSIQNPKGFSNAKLFEMDEILLDLDVTALQEKLVAIEQVRIAGASVTAEQQGTTTNVQALMKHLESQQGEPAANEAEAQASAADEIRIKISRFDFVDASATLITEQFGDAEMDIPNINLASVGGEKGLPPAELASALVKPILDSIKQNTEGMLKGMAEERMREELKKQEDKAREKLKEKEDELKGKLEGKLDENQKEQLDSLKSLFKK